MNETLYEVKKTTKVPITKSWQRPTLPRTPAVPSALEGLTAVFGMGTGVSPPPSSPGILSSIFFFSFKLISYSLFSKLYVMEKVTFIHTLNLTQLEESSK